MRYRKLTSDGDMNFGNGLLNFLTNTPEAVGQAVKTHLLLWLGEWYLDIEEGTAYMQGVIGKHSEASYNSTIQERILSTQDVVSIASYESVLDRETRKLKITATINTIYGVTDIEVSNYANF